MDKKKIEIECNKCKEIINIKEYHSTYFMMGKEKIKETYFECNNCKQRYTVAYDNKITSGIQKKINKKPFDYKFAKTKKKPFDDLQFRVKMYLESKGKLTEYNNTYHPKKDLIKWV